MELCDGFVHNERSLPYKCYKIFEDMRQKKQFCDVILNIGNNSFHAHRVILAASIPYFRTLFLASDMTHLSNDVFLKDVSPLALEALIDFAYKYKLKITGENAPMLLSAACFLQVDEVRKACIEFFFKETSPKNVFSFRQLGTSLSCTELVNKLDDYIAEHFEEITEGQDFFDLPYSYVKDLVSRDDLCVSSEEKVFEAVMKWIKVSPHQVDAGIPELLSCVRMSFLTPKYLKDNVGTHELLRKSHICRDIIDDARDYHFFPEGRDSKNSWKFSTTARRYKKETVESETASDLGRQRKSILISLARSTNGEVSTNRETCQSSTNRETSNLQSKERKDSTEFVANKSSVLDSSKHSGGNLQTNSEQPGINQPPNTEPPNTQMSKANTSLTSLEDTTKELRSNMKRSLEKLLANRPKNEGLTFQEFLRRRKECRKRMADSKNKSTPRDHKSAG